jgi:hypothetical protein
MLDTPSRPSSLKGGKISGRVKAVSVYYPPKQGCTIELRHKSGAIQYGINLFQKALKYPIFGL